MIKKNSLVCLYLQNPKEKFWGRLYEISQHGIFFIGIEIKSFNDWCREIAAEEEITIYPTNFFIPNWRLEKIVLDENQGIFQSFEQQFIEQTGLKVQTYLPKLTKSST